MNLTTTLLFYLLFGAATAVAVHQRRCCSGRGERWFQTVTAVAFWPLYVPALLQPAERSLGPTPADGPADQGGPLGATPPTDALAKMIQQVEAELDLALRSLDGWSDAVLTRERHRFDELRSAWRAQADRIRELDLLLTQPGFAVGGEGPASADIPTSMGEAETFAALQAVTRREGTGSEQARRANIARLAVVRRQLHGDLTNTLAWVRELVTMIHLAKYTGAPASRAEELVMQIATSIEGLSEVASWRELDHQVGA